MRLLVNMLYLQKMSVVAFVAPLTTSKCRKWLRIGCEALFHNSKFLLDVEAFTLVVRASKFFCPCTRHLLEDCEGGESYPHKQAHGDLIGA